MKHLIFKEQSEATNKKLLANRYQDSAYENLNMALLNIKSISGFIADAAVASIESNGCINLSAENLEAVARALVLEAQDALIILESLTESTQGA